MDITLYDWIWLYYVAVYKFISTDVVGLEQLHLCQHFALSQSAILKWPGVQVIGRVGQTIYFLFLRVRSVCARVYRPYTLDLVMLR